MKKTAYILILAFLIGCKPDNHIGSWIQTDNLINPIVLNVYADSMQASNSSWMKTRLYKLKEDTLLMESFNKIEKCILKCSGDTLVLSPVDNDSLFMKYERNTYRDNIEFFNSKLNLSIEIPELDLADQTYFTNCNVFLVDYDEDSKLRIHFNGNTYSVDSTSFLKLLPEKGGVEFNIKNMIVADKALIYRDLKIVKKELAKGRRFGLQYLAKMKDGGIGGIMLRVPPCYNVVYPDSLEIPSLPPLPPMRPKDLTNSKNARSLIGYLPSGIELNGVVLSEKEFKDSIASQIKRIEKYVCVTYFDEELSYESYLKNLNDLYEIYEFVRDEYSQKKYGRSFSELDGSTTRIVKSKFKRRISEVDKEEYEMMKKL